MATYKAGTAGANGSSAMSVFVPALWSSRILKNLHAQQILAGYCTREYEGELKGMGDTVKVHGVGSFTMTDYVTNLTNGSGADVAGIAWAKPTDSELLVEVDAAKYFAFKVEDIETAQANPKFMSELTYEAGIAAAKASDAYIYNRMYDAAVNDSADDWGQRGATSSTNGGVFSVGTSAAPSTTAANFYNALVDCGTRLDDLLCPDDGRFVVVPAFVKGALLKDDRFVSYGTPGNASARDNGTIGSVAGFEIRSMPIAAFTNYDSIETTAVSDLNLSGDSSSLADDYKAIFGRKGAYAYVEQISKVENVRLENYFADGVRGLYLYGGGVIRPQWLGVLQVDDPRAT